MLCNLRLQKSKVGIVLMVTKYVHLVAKIPSLSLVNRHSSSNINDQNIQTLRLADISRGLLVTCSSSLMSKYIDEDYIAFASIAK